LHFGKFHVASEGELSDLDGVLGWALNICLSPQSLSNSLDINPLGATIKIDDIIEVFKPDLNQVLSFWEYSISDHTVDAGFSDSFAESTIHSLGFGVNHVKSKEHLCRVISLVVDEVLR